MVAERAAIGGLGPVGIGTPEKVADDLEHWMKEADIDGFNIAYVNTPGSFEDLVDLLVPELQRRGLYPTEAVEGRTAREKVYGTGQAGVRSDHLASTYKYDVYVEDPPIDTEAKSVVNTATAPNGEPVPNGVHKRKHEAVS